MVGLGDLEGLLQAKRFYDSTKIVHSLSDRDEGLHMPTDFWHFYFHHDMYTAQLPGCCFAGLHSFPAGSTYLGTRLCPKDMCHWLEHRGHLPSPGEDLQVPPPLVSGVDVSKLIKFLHVLCKPFEDIELMNCPRLLPDLCP